MANDQDTDINELVLINKRKILRNIQTTTINLDAITNKTLKNLFKLRFVNTILTALFKKYKTEVSFENFKSFISEYTTENIGEVIVPPTDPTTIIKPEEDISEEVKISCDYVDSIIFNYNDYYKWINNLMILIKQYKNNKQLTEGCLDDINIDTNIQKLKNIETEIENTKTEAKNKDKCGDDFKQQIIDLTNKWNKESIIGEKNLLLQLSKCFLAKPKIIKKKIKGSTTSNYQDTTEAFREHVKAGQEIRKRIQENKNNRFA